MIGNLQEIGLVIALALVLARIVGSSSPNSTKSIIAISSKDRTPLPYHAARPTTATTSTPTSSPSGPMTRARARLLQAKVNSLLSLCDFDTALDGLLLHTHTLCIIRYK